MFLPLGFILHGETTSLFWKQQRDQSSRENPPGDSCYTRAVTPAVKAQCEALSHCRASSLPWPAACGFTLLVTGELGFNVYAEQPDSSRLPPPNHPPPQKRLCRPMAASFYFELLGEKTTFMMPVLKLVEQPRFKVIKWGWRQTECVSVSSLLLPHCCAPLSKSFHLSEFTLLCNIVMIT